MFFFSNWVGSIDVISAVLTATGNRAPQPSAAGGMHHLHAGSKQSSSSNVNCWANFEAERCFFLVFYLPACALCYGLRCVVTGGGSASVNYMSQQTFVLMSWSSHRQTSPVVQKRSLSLLAELIQSTKVGASPLQPLLLLLLWRL